MKKPTKTTRSINLEEYSEEAIPFDIMLRKILEAKPVHRVATKRKLAKRAAKRSAK